jgi:ubiquilin
MGGMGGGMGGGGMGGQGVPAPPADTRPPAERYAAQLVQMREMGFDNETQSIAALSATGGSVQLAIERILDGRA